LNHGHLRSLGFICSEDMNKSNHQHPVLGSNDNHNTGLRGYGEPKGPA